jgi:hypothetical protein
MRTHLVYRLTVGLAAAVRVALVVPNGAPAASVGQFCGGRFGIACDRGLFYDFRAGTCGSIDTDGTCVRIPKLWLQRSFRSVCGCDGKTYSSNCQRKQSIISKRHEGRC